MKSGKFVVRTHSPMFGRVMFILAIIGIVGAGWSAYYFGLDEAGFKRIEANEVQTELEREIAALQDDKAALRDKVALINRSAQVDKQAYQQVKDNLKALQQEILELREEVSFYRGIVSPLESSAGLRIDRFKVEPSGEKNIFHYNLVLTQVLKNDRTVRGTVKFEINGIQNGKPKKLTLRSVTPNKQKYLEFKFRYFQKFDGDFVIPKDFKPTQVLVNVNPHRRKKIKSTYEWPETGKGKVDKAVKKS